MIKYTLEIPNFGTLDTYSDFDISLNYSFEDLSNISAKTSNFSKTILLPGTEVNNNFFQQFFEINRINSYNANKSVACSVRVGDTTIFKGFLKFEEAYVNLEQPEYSVTIVQTTKRFTDIINDKELDALDFTEYNHTRDKNTIQASWNDYIIKNNTQKTFEFGEGYVYPKIVYGNYTDLTKWGTYDAFPAIYVKTIFDKIFDTFGYSYSSNFLETEYFKKLIIPFGGEKLTLSEEQKNQRKANIGVTTDDIAFPTLYSSTNDTVFKTEFVHLDDISSEEFNDVSGQWSTNEFVVGKSGFYNVNMFGNLYFEYYPQDPGIPLFAYSSGDIDYYYTVKLYDSNDVFIKTLADSGRTEDNEFGIINVQPSSTSLQTQPWNDITNVLGLDANVEDIYLEQGDKVKIEFAIKNNATFVNSSAQEIITVVKPHLFRENGGLFSDLDVKVANDILIGDEIVNMQQILPKMSIKDFIGGILNLNHLSFFQDPDNDTNIIIEPIDNFLASKPKVKDWSNLLHRESFDLTPTATVTSRKYNFKYKEDSDYLNTKYKDNFNNTYGNLELTTDNDFNINEDTTELPFASTPVAGDFNVTNIVQPYFVTVDSDNQIKPKAVLPRILFYGGLVDGDTIELVNSPRDTAGVSLSQYPYCGHWDSPVSPKYDLNFDAPNTIYFESDVYPTNNIFNQYYRNPLESIISEDGRFLKGLFNLSPIEVKDVDPRDVIYIDGSHFRIINVKDYNPLSHDKLTEVELIKIIEFNKYQKSQLSLPTSFDSCPTDVVAVKNTKGGDYYVSPSGQPITENCCNSLGGDYTHGVCYVGANDNGGLGSESINVISDVEKPQPTINFNVVKPANSLAKGTNNFINEASKNVLIIGDNNSTAGTSNTVISGKNNVVDSVKSGLIAGDNNVVSPDVNNNTGTVVILGDNMMVENGKVTPVPGASPSTATIVTTAPIQTATNFIQAGRDEVLSPFPDLKVENYINAGRDVVRELGSSDLTNQINAGIDEIL